jgi:uncharacterized protein YecE (DUF72 family)
LEQKLLCLLIQLPPSLSKDQGLPKLERLIPNLWKKYSYAIEVRHKSWFTKEVYQLLCRHGICLTWSQLDAIQTQPELTTDFFYLRFIGDRSISEKDFGKVQKNREKGCKSGPTSSMITKKKSQIWNCSGQQPLRRLWACFILL